MATEAERGITEVTEVETELGPGTAAETVVAGAGTGSATEAPRVQADLVG